MNKANKMTMKTYGHNERGNISDAYRHTLFSALNTRSTGEKFAQKMSDSHEYSSNKGDMDIYMDIHNNDVGREIALQNQKAKKEELSVIIQDRIKRGDMLIMDIETNQLYWSNDAEKKNPVDINDPNVRRSNIARKIDEEL
jgi:hypothetical protein